MRKVLSMIAAVCGLAMFSVAAFAQGTVTGRLVDEASEEGLIAASVTIQGSTVGTVTDFEGNFRLAGVPAGEQTIVLSYVGFATVEQTVTVKDGETTDLGQIAMGSSSIGLSEVNVIASIAVDRKTPIAVSTVTGAEIANTVGNQEFPELLRRTPSIYVTKQGGGVGDARINIRGFDQSNTAVMINGIPVNDMENGWVYWSNWAGLTDVASTVQVQRGLGASKLAIPSVGGSINIITNPAERKQGGMATVGYGNDNYFKASLSYSTGLMDNGLAWTVLLGTTRGDGYVDGTEFETYNYFSSLSYTKGSHTIVATALGAPQVHHQRLQSRFDGITLSTFQQKGIKYNELWGTYKGEEFSWRKNFYHKPKMFLNHYWNINATTNLKTSAYISFGRGGGTGPRGRINGVDGNRYFDSQVINDAGRVEWEAIEDYHQGQNIRPETWGQKGTDADFNNLYTTTSSGNGFIRRASMNYHDWYGILSTLTVDLSDELVLTAGIDARYYIGEHFRRVENLLGLDAYLSRGDDNNPTNYITEASPADFGNFHDNSYKDDNNPNVINYWNDGVVSWAGLFGQLEYSTEKLSVFGTLTGNLQGFKRIDYFNYAEDDTPSNDANDDGEYRETDWQNFFGGVVKAGANYRIDDRQNVFVNAGVMSRPPLFDVVFLDFRNNINEEAANQTTASFEAGYGYRDGAFSLNANVYLTRWLRQFDGSYQYEYTDGTIVDALAVFEVVQLHQGLELEATYTPIQDITIRAMASIGDWTFADDFTSISNTDTDNNTSLEAVTVNAGGQKIGNAAQTTTFLSVDYRPIKGLSISARYSYFDNLYNRFDVGNVINGDAILTNEGYVPVELPSYGLVDLSAFYNFSLNGVNATLGANINNLLNTEYVAEMYTNVSDDPSTPENEFYTQNEGFFGFGRTWNAFLRVNF